jgi:hypothetical protein
MRRASVSIPLLQHLLKLDGRLAVVVQRERDDPPDFWISVGCGSFAVEVTSIVTDHDYAALCSALHSSIKKQCSGVAGVERRFVTSCRLGGVAHRLHFAIDVGICDVFGWSSRGQLRDQIFESSLHLCLGNSIGNAGPGSG